MKKILITSLSLCLMAETTLAASAADTVNLGGNSVAYTPETVTTAEVTLTSVPATGVSTIDFALHYDSAYITMQKVEMGNLLLNADEEAAYEVKIDQENGIINVLWASGYSDSEHLIMTDGTMLILSFIVSENVERKQELSFTYQPVDRPANPDSGNQNKEIIIGRLENNNSVTNYEYTLSPILLHAVASENDFLKGDADENGEVDSDDAALVLRYAAASLLGEEMNCSETMQKNADVNEDDVIDSDDATLILKYAAMSMLGDADWSEILS